MTEPTNDLEALADRLEKFVRGTEGNITMMRDVASSMMLEAATALRSIAAPTTPERSEGEQEGEAVAWMYEREANEVERAATVINLTRWSNEQARGWTETPLYAAHPPAKPDASAEPTGDAVALVEQLWQSDAASALTNRAARRIEELEAALHSRPASDGVAEPSWSRFSYAASVQITRKREDAPEFPGFVIGWYQRLDGARGYVMQHDPHRIVHVNPEGAVEARGDDQGQG